MMMSLACVISIVSLLSFDFGKTATCLYEYTKVESDMLRSMDMLIDWEIYGSNIRWYIGCGWCRQPARPAKTFVRYEAQYSIWHQIFHLWKKWSFISWATNQQKFSKRIMNDLWLWWLYQLSWWEMKKITLLPWHVNKFKHHFAWYENNHHFSDPK